MVLMSKLKELREWAIDKKYSQNADIMKGKIDGATLFNTWNVVIRKLDSEIAERESLPQVIGKIEA